MKRITARIIGKQFETDKSCEVRVLGMIIVGGALTPRRIIRRRHFYVAGKLSGHHATFNYRSAPKFKRGGYIAYTHDVQHVIR